VITINRGQTTATVTFKTPFANTPEIIVTPSNSHAGTTVTIVSKSATGFTVLIPTKDYTSKRTFTYLAFASDKDDAESAPDDLPADIADIYRDINKLDQVVVDEANMVNVYTNPHAILRYGNTYMVYNKLGQVIMVKQYSNPTCTGGTATTPPTCTTPTLLNTQTRTYTGDNRLKNIDTSTYTVNTEYDDKGNKVWEESIDKASGNRKIVTYWTDTERTYQSCTGTTCTTDREERDILVDGRRHATMVVKNGVETYRYYVTSSLGTTTLVLGEDGAILEESDTNPYGDIRYGSNNNEVTTYYGLHERNDTTGLVDMEARMYDPTNLQFSAPDPMSLYNPTAFLSDPQQMHMYAYGRNNPVRYNDPDGKMINEGITLYYLHKNISSNINNYVNNIDTLDHNIREAAFAFQYPYAAARIGPAYDGSEKRNISTIASNFAINMTSDSSVYQGDQNEGSERNSFRQRRLFLSQNSRR
jgi:RHS repeat-associated protein